MVNQRLHFPGLIAVLLALMAQLGTGASVPRVDPLAVLADAQALCHGDAGAPADQAPAKWQAASPIWNVTPKSCPFFVIHGKKDREVYMTQSQSFVELLKLRGVPVRFVKTGSGHTYATVWAKFKLAYGSAGFFKQTLGS